VSTEEFIFRARAVHGSFYDYTNVLYTNYKTKIRIVCPVHGEFFQKPTNHLSGKGCYKCGRANCAKKTKSSKEKFIAKARAVHGSFYDYSKVVYIRSTVKVLIVCPIHGEFTQLPANHLQGQGCYPCGRRSTTLTQKQFIEKANLVHKEKYDYERVFYKNSKEKVCITCPTHGNFYQSPSTHMAGRGCPQCARIIHRQLRLTTEVFRERSIAVHGKEKFDYSKAEYKGPKRKVCIICTIHGEFYQEPFLHMGGKGCKKCQIDSQRLFTKDFIVRANKVHGKGKYDYSRVDIKKNIIEKICVICPIHGEFWQNAWSHLDGCNCPTCGYIATARGLALTKEEFIQRALQIHGNKYNYSSVDYVNKDTKVCIICKKHGKFYQRPASHVGKESGCPFCKGSKGERAIQKWFKKYGVDFKHHHSFFDLRGIKNPLIFDFYVPFVKCLIEFDGQQHYKPVRFNGISKKRAIAIFKKNRYYDALKDQYCVKKNISLLRINYKEYKNIPKILSANLQGINSASFARPYVNDFMTSEQADCNAESLSNNVGISVNVQ